MGAATIKGIFVNSHIKAVRRERGDDGVRELERRYGRPLLFRNSEDVPVAEEVRLIGLALDIISGQSPDRFDHAFEAGRLHFRNFATTPLARITFSLFRANFKFLMLQAPHIAAHVFSGAAFGSRELGATSVAVSMDNDDYPIEHFQGLFWEWLHFSGLTGTVEARRASATRSEYVITWS